MFFLFFTLVTSVKPPPLNYDGEDGIYDEVKDDANTQDREKIRKILRMGVLVLMIFFFKKNKGIMTDKTKTGTRHPNQYVSKPD